jgi:hypothetical protein
MEDDDGGGRRQDEHVVGQGLQHLGAELHHHYHDQPDCPGRDAVQECLRPGVVAADAVGECRRGHESGAGQAHAEGGQ